MSYAATGAYYEFSPHEVYAASGYGAFGTIADTFSASAIMADVAISDECYGPGGPCIGPGPALGPGSAACKAIVGRCNAASIRASKMVQAGLNELGYGPIAVDGSQNWIGPWKRYLSDEGMTPGPGLGLSLAGLLRMEQQLKAGEKPGPAPAKKFTKVNGEIIPVTPPVVEPKPTGLAALGGMGIALIAVAAIGVGYVVYKGTKRRPGTTAMVRR